MSKIRFHPEIRIHTEIRIRTKIRIYPEIRNIHKIRALRAFEVPIEKANQYEVMAAWKLQGWGKDVAAISLDER